MERLYCIYIRALSSLSHNRKQIFTVPLSL